MRILITAAVAFAGAALGAQAPPPVRQIGRLEHVTTDSLASIASALVMPDGGVLVNDRIAHRVLRYDSTLAHATVVADTTAATANIYGQRPANLIHYRGDSALLIDQTSLSMFVIGPRGAVGRVMAIPRANDAQAMIAAGSGVDARGRLIYSNALSLLPGILMLGRGDLILKDQMTRWAERTDSAPLLRVDPPTRQLDTIAWLRIPKLDRELKLDDAGHLTSIVNVPDPLPVVDHSIVLHDGTVAIVRGRDYHVDWLGVDGTWSSTPRMAFDWRRLDDARKQALIDSTVKSWQAQYDRVVNGGGRSGRGGGDLAPIVAVAPPLSSVFDYVPPFPSQAGGPNLINSGPILNADADGNLWIRTTNVVAGRPVFDVVSRRGEVIDRVQLPAFRSLAGFGPGVIYMAVKDSAGIVRLERARIR
ncbi:MAG TPA: hypothetical protein VN706_11770 [Gemmatimonadaceae bacterium]|nr:hypothetical protein [Gemmatimonadaceae bacterium]